MFSWMATKEEIKAELNEFLPRFRECVSRALQRYVDEYKALRHLHTTRTDASIIHDLMVNESKKAFGDASDPEATGRARVHKKGNLVQVVVDNRFKFRLKRLDRQGRARNIPTQSVLNFNDQQQAFEQVPDPVNLYLGYQLPNGLTFTEATVLVMCPDGTEVGWSFVIEPLVAQVLTLQPEAAAAAAAQAAPSKRKAKLKAGVIAHNERKTGDGTPQT
jgi:hypothetical protein